jgi:hypothetical protein
VRTSRLAGELQQVVLEDLDAVEARGGDRLQLVAQHARQRDGGDGATHARLRRLSS